MARRYHENIDLFGPEILSDREDYNVQECQRLVKRGYSRVMEKIKKLRQSFSNAVITGSRSGSGKLVAEHYDQLVTIWGGSASAEPLSFGSASIMNKTINASTPSASNASSDDIFDTPPDNESSSTKDDDRDGDGSALGLSESDDESQGTAKIGQKRRSNVVPLLVDNKRKHLEKGLSAKQRDQILLKEAKEENIFRKDLCEPIRSSNELFAQAMTSMSASMAEIAKSLGKSIGNLTQGTASEIPVQEQPMMVPYQNMASTYNHSNVNNAVYYSRQSYNQEKSSYPNAGNIQRGENEKEYFTFK